MNNKKPKLVLLRGPSAVGKTTIAKSLLLFIKNDLKKDCAFISEDSFRKQMQFKYKAKDKKVHLNSVKLITKIIEELTSLDSYDIIVIEGLFRYIEMIKQYTNFANQENYELKIFQLTAPIEIRKREIK